MSNNLPAFEIGRVEFTVYHGQSGFFLILEFGSSSVLRERHHSTIFSSLPLYVEQRGFSSASAQHLCGFFCPVPQSKSDTRSVVSLVLAVVDAIGDIDFCGESC